jgi:hypothetical protein
MTDTVLVGTQAVIIEGYLDGWEPPLVPSPLVDAGAMPARPGFWPAFLYAVGLSKSAAEAFDDDLADVSVLIDELVDPTAWPVLSIRLHRGHLLHIVMRNFPDDAGVDFVIAPPVGGRYIPLAAMEGSFRGPGLSWPELVAAARQPDDVLSPAARMLLLLPITGDTHTPAHAAPLIAKALTSVGATRLQDVVASELLNVRAFWAPATWTTVQGVRVCDGHHSYRTLGGLTRQQLELVDEALGAVAAHNSGVLTRVYRRDGQPTL